MRALITRPRENAGPIARALAERGFDLLLEPLLEIRSTDHGPVDLADVQAVLVTSAFGARELAGATAERAVPVYAVGDATAEAASEGGFTTVESARGDGEALARLVIERLDPARGPLLYAAGRVTAGEFPEQLVEAGFEVRKVELYAARPAAALSMEAVAALRDGSLDLALFFSPRTAATFVRLVEEAGLSDSCRGVTALALSANVAEALRPLSWRAVETADDPDHDSMVALADGWLTRHRQPEPEPVPEPRPAARVAEEPVVERRAASPLPPPRRSGAATAALLLVLLFGAAAAIGGYALWQGQQQLGSQIAQEQRPVAEDPAFKALEERAASAESRLGEALAAVERRLTARFAEAEKQVKEATLTAAAAVREAAAIEGRLAQQPPPTDGTEAEALAALRQQNEALAARLGETEQALQAATRTLGERLALAEQADAQLAQEVAGATERAAAAAKTFEQQLAELTRATEQAANDNTVALLLAAGQIRTALDAGRPFAAPMATLQRLAGGDAKVSEALAGWSDHAAKGIPTVAELRERFGGIATQVRPAVVQPDTGMSWFDQIWDRAASIVRVRRVGEEVAGDAPEAILARAEAGLNDGDLARAVAEIEKLAPEVRQPFAEWLADAHARLAAGNGLAALERAAIESAGGG